jgi:hypothetical protein
MIIVAVALATAPGRAHALDYSGVGGRLGYTSPDERNGTAELGVHAELAEPGTRVSLLPSLLYWKSDALRDVNPNLDLCYQFEPARRAHPYLGGGLGFNFLDEGRFGGSSTEAGMNLIGGVRFPGQGHNVFVEARHTLSDVSRTAVMAGITFNPR